MDIRDTRRVQDDNRRYECPIASTDIGHITIHTNKMLLMPVNIAFAASIYAVKYMWSMGVPLLEICAAL